MWTCYGIYCQKQQVIDEKVTEDTAYQNFLNAKSFTTNAAHISMTPPFYYYCLAFWGIFDAFHDAISRY